MCLLPVALGEVHCVGALRGGTCLRLNSERHGVRSVLQDVHVGEFTRGCTPDPCMLPALGDTTRGVPHPRATDDSNDHLTTPHLSLSSNAALQRLRGCRHRGCSRRREGMLRATAAPPNPPRTFAVARSTRSGAPIPDFRAFFFQSRFSRAANVRRWHRNHVSSPTLPPIPAGREQRFRRALGVTQQGQAVQGHRGQLPPVGGGVGATMRESRRGVAAAPLAPM